MTACIVISKSSNWLRVISRSLCRLLSTSDISYF